MFCYMYLFKSKDEAFKALRSYKNEVKNQLNAKIKMIRSDKCAEYVVPSKVFYRENDIIHQTVAPESP